MKTERKIADTSEINTQTALDVRAWRVCRSAYICQFFRWTVLFLYLLHIRHYFRTINFMRCPNHIPKWDNKKVAWASHQARQGNASYEFTPAHAPARWSIAFVITLIGCQFVNYFVSFFSCCTMMTTPKAAMAMYRCYIESLFVFSCHWTIIVTKTYYMSVDGRQLPI